MSLPKERIAYLLQAYTLQKATVQEEQELMEWIEEAEEDSALKAYIETAWEQQQPGKDFSHVNWDAMFDRVIHKNPTISIAPASKRKSAWWINYRWVAAAAAILVLIASATYFFLTSDDKNEAVANKGIQLSKDVAPPATNKATLTLANGKVIVLDSAGMGSLATEGVANASKVNEAELVYAAGTYAAVEFHTLNVPKGSKPMQLQLADGSDVWLNAASSITFPNVFAGTDRKVTVTGEAYFEVAKITGKKFFVEANGTTTEVLGTHFNINAYNDEPEVKITLLEGSVKVNNGTKEGLLKPGQQARATNAAINVHSNVNIDEVMAWKNGFFEFNETDIQTIMRQVERWYDVEIVFEGNVSQHFNGTIQRQVNASRLLNMLEKTGGIRFIIEDRKVIVKKY